MDIEQKSYFSKWVKKNSRKRAQSPKYWKLYRRMLDSEGYDERQIRSNLFEKAGDYYKNRELLLEKIVHCFAKPPADHLENYHLIVSAMEFGALELAKKYFAQEVVSATKQEDTYYLLRLGRLRDEKWEDYRLDLAEQCSLSPTLDLVDQLSGQIQPHSLIQLSRKAFRGSPAEKKWLANRIEQYLDSTTSDSYVTQKLRVHFFILEGDHKRASQENIELGEGLIREKYTCSIAQRIRSLSNAITSCLILKNREKATYLAFHITNLQTQNDLQEDLKKVLLVKRNIELGFVFGDFDFLNAGFQTLSQNLSRLDNQEIANYLYTSALGMFQIEALEKGHEIIRLLDQQPRAIRSHFPWEIDVLDLFFHVEKGNWDYLEMILESKSRKFRALQYPRLICEAIRAIGFAGGAVNESMVQSFQARQKAIVDQEGLSRDEKNFNLALYLKSKQRGTSIRELIKDQTDFNALPLAK